MSTPSTPTQPKVALITGITGQDGSYLAEFLLEKGYIVHGTGDVAQCFADATLAKDLLGWRAKHTLADMCTDAWSWQSNNPDGYV